MYIGRWKKTLIFLVAMQGALFVGCRTSAERQVAASQRLLDDSGFIEIPYGFQISSFTVPPCHVIFPALAKNPGIWLLTRPGIPSVALVPSRAENGEYSLLIVQDYLTKSETRLAVLSREGGTSSVFLAENGSVVKMYDQWCRAVFFTSSGEGLVAWKDGFMGDVPLCNPEDIPDIVCGINWKDGKDTPPCYRRFYLKGSKNTSGPHLLHEIWPEKEIHNGNSR
ncbi:MAG: hypothetical protein IJT01_08235 [Selenomonadaceae bacterium]|nr:hypothetical protein [Selenomonadaceae bacterium]